MAYQKCPICEGAGVIATPLMTTCFETCPVCKGARIIDELFGVPPGCVDFKENEKPKTFKQRVAEELEKQKKNNSE